MKHKEKPLTELEQEAIKKARRKYLNDWRQKDREKKKEAQRHYMERFYLKKAVEYGFI